MTVGVSTLSTSHREGRGSFQKQVQYADPMVLSPSVTQSISHCSQVLRSPRRNTCQPLSLLSNVCYPESNTSASSHHNIKLDGGGELGAQQACLDTKVVGAKPFAEEDDGEPLAIDLDGLLALWPSSQVSTRDWRRTQWSVRPRSCWVAAYVEVLQQLDSLTPVQSSATWERGTCWFRGPAAGATPRCMHRQNGAAASKTVVATTVIN
eukprot:CAMPEP_0202890814 /NCGR_PEP_ID=MMETSP1392-20130828/1104_1 /ASSEMBLY_ACC=CAM_ASM_000868 /TAXON_ID=225041 /ORGANISM="Chlamydomonas chlamydogama, Strain SAG 11-48b" /LENGTH=207 /DNA_ID=CAMNT_0049574457 /DNA_START=205 /DNA_END=829 /DNA_ORIENTATION=-